MPFEWLSKLKDLIKFKIDNVSLFNNNNFLNFNSSKKIVNNIYICTSNTKKTVEHKENKLYLNLKKFSFEEQEQLKSIIKQAELEEVLILKNKSKNTINNILEFKNNEVNLNTYDKLKNIIPKEDSEILKQALYLRHEFENGKSIHSYKSEITAKYGRKGTNICNLCTKKYFEEWIIPIYESLKENINDEDLLQKKFNNIYEIIVLKNTFTIFVHHNMKISDISHQIEKRINYGNKIIHVHGMGKENVKKIRESLEKINKKYNFIKTSEEAESNNIITVYISINKNKN
jgi:hypothetical protein